MKNARTVVVTAIFGVFAKRVKSGVQEPPETNEPMPSEMAMTMPTAVLTLSGAVAGWCCTRTSQPFLIAVASMAGLFAAIVSTESKKSAWIADQPPRIAMAGTETTEMTCSALMPK